MTLTDYLFDSSIGKALVTEPNLNGGSLKQYLHFGDLQNALSVGTASNILSAGIVKESAPYYREYDSDNVLTIFPTWHFITGLRRQLSGDVTENTSTFSPRENSLYTKYQAWQLGATEEDEVLQALETIDSWLIDEITNTPHKQLNRDYGDTHKWNKIFKREVV